MRYLKDTWKEDKVVFLLIVLMPIGVLSVLAWFIAVGTTGNLHW